MFAQSKSLDWADAFYPRFTTGSGFLFDFICLPELELTFCLIAAIKCCALYEKR